MLVSTLLFTLALTHAEEVTTSSEQPAAIEQKAEPEAQATETEKPQAKPAESEIVIKDLKLVITPPATLPADSRVGKTTQIFRDKKKVVIAVDKGIKTEQLPKTLIFTNKKAESCDGEVEQASDGKAVVNLSTCSLFDQIAAGDVFRTPIFKIEKPAETPTTTQQATEPAPQPVEQPTPQPKPREGHVSQLKTTPQRIVDLQYFQPERTFGITVGVFDRDTKGTVDLEPSGDTVYDWERRSTSLSAELKYGITDFVSVGVAYSHFLSDSQTDTYGSGSIIPGAKQDFKASGGTEPTFGLKFRTMSQEIHKVNFDVDVAYSPKTGGQVGATTTNDGNELRGADAGKVGISVGQRFKHISYIAGIASWYYGAGDTTDASTGEVSHFSRTSSFSVFASGQVRASEYLEFRLGLKSTSNSSSKTTSATSSDFNADSYTTSTLSSAIIFPITDKVGTGVNIDLTRTGTQTASRGTVLLSGSGSNATVSVVFAAEL